MSDQMPNTPVPPNVPPRSIVLPAVAFEGSLILLALGAGWLVGQHPLETVPPGMPGLGTNAVAALWGVAAAMPMLLGLVVVEWFPWGPLSRLREIVDVQIIPLFAKTSWAELAVLSFLAGVGEEMLFRGVLQAALAESFGGIAGPWIALAVAALTFGLAHAVSREYLVFAVLIGAYLGGIFIVAGNLITPMVAHGLYDFVALVYLTRRRRATSHES